MKHARVAAAAAFAVVLVPTSAKAVPVDLELALLVDVSGSVSASEFNLQRQGYVSAFQDPGIAVDIERGTFGSIAASLISWSGGAQQQQAVHWTVISDSARAHSFEGSRQLIDICGTGLTPEPLRACDAPVFPPVGQFRAEEQAK